MKVKNLIEELKQLDQERSIFVVYDMFYVFDPIPDETATKEKIECYGYEKSGVKEGDYLIYAS